MNVDNRTLFIADNLDILRGIDSKSVDLIATDPPFNKGVKAFEGIVTAGIGKGGKQVSYKDTWTWSDVQDEWTQAIRQDHPNLHAVIRGANAGGGEDMSAFICWLAVRVLEMHRVLKPTGSLYLHCDQTAAAYIKAMMDAIFGRQGFRNEIVWRRYGSHNDARNFGRVCDVLLYYAKDGRGVWNGVYTDHDPDYIEQAYKNVDKRGKYTTGPLHAGGLSGGGYQYEYYGHNRIWKFPRERLQQLEDEGRIHFPKRAGGMPRRKIYLDENRGKSVMNIWDDIRSLTSDHKERTGYPTQKPLALYERIIKASSNEGDLVLDPFCGCATTCVAAERLERQWVGIDINKEAQTVIRDRLKKEVDAGMNWRTEVSVRKAAPKRTDDGREAAAELVLVSPKPKARNLTARELRGRLAISDGLKCQGCGWIPHHEEYLEVDHRVPRSAGGKDDIRNRVLLCSPCNGAKGNKLTLAELRIRRLEERRMVDKTWDAAWYERVGRHGGV